MTTFVDTSGIIPYLDRNDADHSRAAAAFETLLRANEELLTHNYVLVETTSVVAHRFGLEFVRRLEANLIPLLTVVWVSDTLHVAAMGTLLTANRRQLSLVDCVSFAVMRERQITNAFAIDRHFVELGIQCVPSLAVRPIDAE